MSFSPLAASGPAISASSVLGRRVVLAVVAVALLAVALPANSFGVQTRPEISTFDGSDSDAGAFAVVGRIAVHQATGTVYVIDIGAAAVDKFDASGAAQDFSALSSSSLDGTAVTAPDGPVTFDLSADSDLAVDNSGGATDGRVYVLQEYGATPHTAYAFAADGSYLHKIDVAGADTCGITVDAQGDVWISDYNSASVREYSPAGTATGNVIDTSAQGQPCHIAFDSAGNLYVALYGGALHKYDAAGAYVGQIDGASTAAVAVHPVTGHVFAAHENRVSEYDSAGALVGEFGQPIILAGVAVLGSADDVYVPARGDVRIHVFGGSVPFLPDVSTGSATVVTPSTATLNGSVNPDGLAVTDCHFEYTDEVDFQASGFANATDATCVPDPGSGSDDVAVAADITGLAEDTTYRFRLIAGNANGSSTGSDQTLQTPIVPGPALVEAMGSPVRTPTSARLDARVNPRYAPTDYHFEYGTAPCDANPCTSTAPHPAGSSNTFTLVSQQVTGLQPDTTYHYRVIADNGNPAGPSIGEDRTVTTPASDVPLSHGAFPGPPGSDRAWEQVNAPDTGGNPVGQGVSFSDDGSRAVYYVAGGTPDAAGGSLLTQLFTERSEPSPHRGGWRLGSGYPARSQIAGGVYHAPVGPTDLSAMTVANISNSTDARKFFRVTPGAPATDLFVPAELAVGAQLLGSEGSTRAVAKLQAGGVPDPDYPDAGAVRNLYDISSGSPKLVSQLPGNVVAPCDVGAPLQRDHPDTTGGGEGRAGNVNWISPNGNFVFFPSTCGGGGGGTDLFVRDIAADETRLVSKPPSSGPDCAASMLQSNDDAVFFWTQSRLTADDTAVAACDDASPSAAGGDVYRYDLAGDSLQCVTCIATAEANVPVNNGPGGSFGNIAVARDGSRVYFSSPNRLLPGAAAGGAYRVDVSSGDLAYVVPGARVGDYQGYGNAISRDGSVVVFRSDDPRLNAVGGQQNGGTGQFYRYDDRDRSLVCVSCPLDGSLPRAAVKNAIVASDTEEYTDGNNIGPIDGDGDVFFPSPTALVAADQNTARSSQAPSAGQDVYEWRDGRLLLVTDGTSDWSAARPPTLQGVNQSGRDVFFIAAARLTADAIDSFSRLYDARIGGGFEFPDTSSVPLCPLEACQGDPSPAPGDADPGSSRFDGTGNPVAPARGGLRVSKARATGFAVRLKVKVSGRGRLVASGRGLRATSRSVTKASTVTLRIALNGAGRRQLAERGRVKRKVKVAFRPAGGATASRTLTLTFKAPNKRGH